MELKRARTMLNYVILALAIGAVGAVAKLVYSFYPGANLVDAAVFGVLGNLAGRLRPDRRWTMAAAVALPALVLVTWILAGVGPGEVGRSAGAAWVRSAWIIPLAALAGAAIHRARPGEKDGD